MTIPDDDQGLAFKLGEGVEGGGREKPAPPAPTTRLSDEATAKVLARMKPIGEADKKEFALREGSLPAPRTGKTVEVPFPPPKAPPAPDASEAGPLSVVRHLPDGEVPLAPHVSLTFSQPMVPVTSLAELDKLPVPAKLTPQVPGRWRWIGTKTLLFEATAQRMPMATEFTVEVPAGTASATGGKLAEAARFQFATPTVTLQSIYPGEGESLRRDPTIFASFDQNIDPAAVLATVRVEAGGKTVALRLATEEEIKSDRIIKDLMAGLTSDGNHDHALVFRPSELLPVDSAVTVTFGPGTPSAEGPRKTAQPQAKSLHTYGAMKVVQHSCDNENECPPGSGFWVEFSNPIEAKKFAKDMVSVSPALPSLKVFARGNNVSIVGRTKPRTSYAVKLASGVPDVYGQTMGHDETITFKTGSAQASLFAMGGTFVVLDPDPKAGTKFSVYSVTHKELKVRAFAQTPETWAPYNKFMREVWSREQYPPDPPGKKVLDQTVPVKGEPDELSETQIDLASVLGGTSGNVVLVVEPTVRPKNRWEWSPVVVWIQVTPIGLDAIVDGEKLIAWATRLSDGKPLEGVQVSVQPTGSTGTTDASGTARLPLGSPAGSMLVARQGDATAFLPESTAYWGDRASWLPSPPTDSYHWYVADDRQMYKPGEEVKLKGWIRKVAAGPQGDVVPWANDAAKVTYKLQDSRGNEVGKGEATLNALGGFDATLKLPGNMNLGYASVVLEAPGIGQMAHGIQVQEFRRPEFEVSADPAEGPYLVGGKTTVSVNAKYFAGGGLANADTHWTVSARPGSFTPPNRDEFSFGIFPSWYDSWEIRRGAPAKTESFAAHTDSGGKHVVGIDFLGVSPPRATNVMAQATVMDVNRQAWTATANLLVHPSSLYVGVKLLRPYVQQGEELKLDTITTDLDGKAVTGRKVHVRAVRLDWDDESGEIAIKEVDPRECDLTSSDKPERCTLKTGEGGLYRIYTTVADDKGRKNLTQISVWVAGGKLPPQRGVAIEEVKLISDRKEYRAGETAEILVVSPFYPAEALLTLRRQGVFKVERFAIPGASTTIKVPIEDGYTPNLFVAVDVLGQKTRTNPDGEPDPKLGTQPAVGAGEVSLSIPPLSRRLDLTVTPRDAKLEPGGQTTLDVKLQNAGGEPVAGGEVAVVVVDEAILSLTGYRIADPLPTFYQAREPGAREYHLRQNVLLAKPPEEIAVDQLGNSRGGGAPGGAPMRAMKVAAPMMAMAMSPPPAPPAADAAPSQPQPEPAIKVRTDFNALAVFAPSVKTDAQGRAQVAVKLPDNLTRYRVMAIAVAGGKQFGAGESAITARLPLMVRPSPPRFLNFGDKVEMSVVVQNQTDKPVDVDVAMRAANAELTAGGGRHLQVAANDRAEIRFPLSATMAGTARFQFAAVATTNNRWADAAELSIPVWTPATTEAFATYGTIDQGAISQPVKMPEGVFPQFGGVQISTSSTALQALTDAVMYLQRYPYECSEQLSSRLMSVAALRDVLTAFKADGLPSPEAMIESSKKDIELLRRIQNGDGGWPFWKRGDESWPFLTLHVAHALSRAKDKGFDVPAPMLDQVKPYLRDIESHIPGYYGTEVRRALTAYSLYVRARMGDRDVAKAERLIAEAGGVTKLPLEAVGWIYPVVTSESTLADIRKLIGNRIEETAAAAHFVTDYSDGNYLLLHSDRRVDAIFLEGLIGDQPKSDVIPKLVEGLLGHRTAGHWSSTQENSWVLLALDRYFNTYEKVTPDFVARVWLGPAYAGDHTFKGRTTERANIDIPMSWLAAKAHGAQDLVLSKDGAGRLYYRIGMSYAPTDLNMPPRDAGFTVQRQYEAVDDPKDVQLASDGIWHIQAGARVRVRVTMVVPTRRYHVALVDPLPAGLEALNPALKNSAAPPPDPNAQNDPRQSGRYWWWGPWYQHENLRDERVEAFSTLVWEGVHEYVYIARATSLGSFVVPAPKAEEMYHPETFGRGGTDRVVVE